jgi:peptide/nickel transport system substrate-binding protein
MHRTGPGRCLHRLTTAAAALALGVALAAGGAAAQEPKHGGTLRIYQRDNPASASLHEEATFSTTIPFMAVFNNLVLYRQDVPQNSMQTIVPELATAWAWSADNLKLTFRLRDGVKWHDGKPFTAQDVKCTMDLLQDKATDRFRKNPRKNWYDNVAEVSVDNPHQVTFRLNRPQPSLLALLASGYSAVYPCHVPQREMRTHPIGTGPFKFVEFRQNEIIRLARNADYWRPGRPYLDAIELPVITNHSTAMLAFVAGKVDMTFPTEVTVPLLKDIKAQAPAAQCFIGPTNFHDNLIVNRDRQPFGNPDIRRAMALAIDRRAFIDILSEGQSDMGGALLPPPEGAWGMPREMLGKVIGYDPDVEKSRTEARAIMARLGYGPDKPLRITVSARNIPAYRDPAVILIDHLRKIWIEGELETLDTGVWFAKMARKDYAVGINVTGNAIDDPDQAFYENYACGSERNVTGYCNPALQKMIDAQSAETNFEKRRAMVWEIDRQLQEDVARPVIMHIRSGTCWQPQVKGWRPMVNSSYNGYRFEDIWLDR